MEASNVDLSGTSAARSTSSTLPSERVPYPMFEGNPGDSAEDWIQQLRVAFDLNGYNDPARQLALAQTHAKGRARELCLALGNTWLTFDDMAQAMCFSFPTTSAFADRMKAYLGVTQDPGMYDANHLFAHLQDVVFGLAKIKSIHAVLILILYQCPNQWATTVGLPSAEELTDPAFNLFSYLYRRRDAIDRAHQARQNSRRGPHHRTDASAARSSGNSGFARPPRDDAPSARLRGYNNAPPRAGSAPRIAALAPQVADSSAVEGATQPSTY